MMPDRVAFQNEFIPVVTQDRNIRSRTKSGRTFHNYHVKEVGAYSGTELDTWIGWADQLTHTFDLSVFLLHFSSGLRTLYKCVIQYACRSRIKFTPTGIM